MAPSPPELEAARALLARERHGVLSTLHPALDGWPFGSVVPYALTDDGDPVLLLSSIAEHTRALAADPRACLLVLDSAARERPQEGSRLALVARAEVPTGAAAEAAAEVYFARFPASRAHLAAHAFLPHVLRVDRVRWIAGFGSMGWWSRDEWAPAVDPLAPHARAICAHMNTDHADALVTLAKRHAGVDAAKAVMTGVDVAGIDVDAFPAGAPTPTRVRIAFPAPTATPDAVRRTLVAMLAAARRG